MATAGIAAFVLGCAWFKLIGMMFAPVHSPAWLPLVAGSVGGLSSYALFRALSFGAWSDMHRWSASFGAVMASMAIEYLSTAGWKHADLVFKEVLNVLAFLGLVWLGIAVHRRKARTAA
jgi:hypothetical protein